MLNRTGLQGLFKGQWVRVWQVLRVLEKILFGKKDEPICKKKKGPFMLMKVYRLYSEGSGELFESFVWDLLSLFKKQLSGTSWEVACRHTLLLCV